MLCALQYFPGLAPVIRESLFEAARSRSDIRDDEAHHDGATVEGFLVEELAPSVLELADRGWANGTGGAVVEIEAPLAGLRIVETQGERTGGILGLNRSD
jgi:hypothetical protein